MLFQQNLIFFFLQNRVPLYQGAYISKEEAHLLLFNFVIRHHLTDIALEHLIQLIDILLPRPAFRSKYFFLKQFGSETFVRKIYYCPNCTNVLNCNEDGANEKITCLRCNERFDKSVLSDDMKYFVRRSAARHR